MNVNFQDIAVGAIFIGAVVFMLKKFFFVPKSKKENGCSSGNCNC